MTTLIYPDRPCVNGHISPRYVYSKNTVCVQCNRERNIRASKERVSSGKNKENLRKWVSDNRDYANSRRREWSVSNPEKSIVNACKNSSKKRGIPFDLSHKDISIPDVCPILGIPLTRGSGSRTDGSPSIDRIIPSKGYVKGNVIIISWRANRIKNDGSLDELRAIVDFYSRLHDIS